MTRARAAAASRPCSARKKKSKAELYHNEMRKLMSFLHWDKTYQPGHKWTKRQLLAITPKKILRYIKIKVYDNEDANTDKDPPIYHFSNSVLFWKRPGSIICWTRIISGWR